MRPHSEEEAARPPPRHADGVSCTAAVTTLVVNTGALPDLTPRVPSSMATGSGGGEALAATTPVQHLALAGIKGRRHQHEEDGRRGGRGARVLGAQEIGAPVLYEEGGRIEESGGGNGGRGQGTSGSGEPEVGGGVEGVVGGGTALGHGGGMAAWVEGSGEVAGKAPG